jgi:hypothetical protein
LLLDPPPEPFSPIHYTTEIKNHATCNALPPAPMHAIFCYQRNLAGDPPDRASGDSHAP